MHQFRQSPGRAWQGRLFRDQRREVSARHLYRPGRIAGPLPGNGLGRAVQVNDHVAGLSLDALRQDLAAAFRLTARFGWHESVGNHFSVAVSDGGRHFLMNPRWRHFGSLRASDLLLLDADDTGVMERPDAPDASAWTVHGTLHRARPDVRVILHCHPPHATALAALRNPSMPPIDMNTARFFGDLAIDPDCGGIADDAAEGARIAAALGSRSTLL